MTRLTFQVLGRNYPQFSTVEPQKLFFQHVWWAIKAQCLTSKPVVWKWPAGDPRWAERNQKWQKGWMDIDGDFGSKEARQVVPTWQNWARWIPKRRLQQQSQQSCVRSSSSKDSRRRQEGKVGQEFQRKGDQEKVMPPRWCHSAAQWESEVRDLR